MTDRCASARNLRVSPEQQRELEIVREHMQRVGEKLLVLSGKGGVGKSTARWRRSSPG